MKRQKAHSLDYMIWAESNGKRNQKLKGHQQDKWNPRQCT